MQQPPNDQPDWQQPQYPDQPNWQQSQQSGQLPPQYTQYPYQQSGPEIPPPPQYTQYPYQQPMTPGMYPPQQPPVQPSIWRRKFGCAPVWLITLVCAILMCSVLSYASTNNTKSIDTTSATLSDSQIAATNSAQLAATNDAVSTAVAPVPTATTDTSIPTDTPVPTQAPPQLQHWTFTGNGTQKTAQFTTNSGTWKISWKCDPAAYGFEYNLIVEIDDSSSNYVDGPVNVICKTSVTSGSTMEYNLQGTYYLNVNSEGPWTIKIQEQ